MKKEQKAQVFAAAEKMCLKYDDVKVATIPKIIDSPDAVWVSAWIKVPRAAVQDQQIASRIAAAGAP